MLFEFDDDFTWDEVFNDVTAKKGRSTFELCKTDQISINIRAKPNSPDVFHPDMHEKIRVVKNFDSTLKYVIFEVIRESTGQESAAASSSGNAFSIMMDSRKDRKLPRLRDASGVKFTAKDKLYNDVCEELGQSGVGFPVHMADSEVSKQICGIVDSLWYIDGNVQTIGDRAKHLTDELSAIPPRFAKFEGYNDWKRKKMKKPNLNAKDLDVHSRIVFQIVSRPYVQRWGEIRSDLEAFAVSLNAYANFLKSSNEKQQHRQFQSHPPRQVAEHVWIEHKLASSNLEPQYSKLNSALTELDEYDVLFFNPEIHSDLSLQTSIHASMEKFRFFQGLSVLHDIVLLTFDPGSSMSSTKVLWRVPQGVNSSDLMTTSSRIVKELETRLPEFHTRQMRKEFQDKFCNVAGTKIPPHILRAIYSDITLDASADQNPEMDARVRQALLAEEPDLIVDLRHLNKGFRGDTFDLFFEELEREVDSIAAADERRHQVEHISRFISVRDLIDQVKSNLPPNTPVPSESTVLFAFVPRNAHAQVAKLYKGRIPLRLTVQTRQLRASHPDDHFCAAQFKFMRHFAVKFKDSVEFVCMDDKSKVDFGEPGYALSSGVRGKKSIVPSSSTLSCLDHDVNRKGSLTPSVYLNVQIPEACDDTFYRGDVTVIFKDSIFQPSSPFRHSVELQNLLEEKGVVKPVLMIFTDGGPDHRVTYHAVKLSLVVLFRRLGLDMIIAGRTAPGHSWANPAERIMSLLNLAFQNAALTRNETTSAFEQVIKSCNGMADLRKKSESVAGLEDAWTGSLQEMIHMLEERVQRVQLKGRGFRCLDAASKVVISAFEDGVKDVDPDIIKGQYQQVSVSKKQTYMDFLKTHCQERWYTFQIRKCNDPTCCVPPTVELPWLPDPVLSQDGHHFKTLDQLLGVPTTDKDRPSSQKQSLAYVAEDQQGCKNSVLVGQNVRDLVKCRECGKPRCVYSKTALTGREVRAFKRLVELYDYTCGSLLTPDGNVLQGKLFIRLQLCCSTPVEFPFYSSSVGRKDTCCHCGGLQAEKDKDLLRSFRVVLPICQDCKLLGFLSLKRNPIKK